MADWAREIGLRGPVIGVGLDQLGAAGAATVREALIGARTIGSGGHPHAHADGAVAQGPDVPVCPRLNQWPVHCRATTARSVPASALARRANRTSPAACASCADREKTQAAWAVVWVDSVAPDWPSPSDQSPPSIRNSPCGPKPTALS